MNILEVLFSNNIAWVLIIVGIVFIIAEAYVFSFGALGITGLIAFMLGLVILVDVYNYNLEIALPFLILIGLIGAVFVSAIIYLALKARHRPIVSGRESLLGSIAKVMVDEDGIARVKIHGELWQVEAEQSLKNGQRVKVLAIGDNLILKVSLI